MTIEDDIRTAARNAERVKWIYFGDAFRDNAGEAIGLMAGKMAVDVVRETYDGPLQVLVEVEVFSFVSREVEAVVRELVD